MAHFAKLDTNNVVTQVIVVANEDCQDADGNESEAVGIAFCQSLFGDGSNWKQTSYNSNMRVHYAGIGYSYNETLDAFIAPKPYPSWILNEESCVWEAPIPLPSNNGEIDDKGFIIDHTWDENTQSWIEVHEMEAP